MNYLKCITFDGIRTMLLFSLGFSVVFGGGDSPKAVSNSSSSQTCLDHDASFVLLLYCQAVSLGFSFIDNYSRFIKPEEPLPCWDSSVVEEFIASDPIHGPTLKTAREASTFGVVGAAVGAVSTARFAWKWSRSPHEILLHMFTTSIRGLNCSKSVTLQVRRTSLYLQETKGAMLHTL